MHTKSGLQYFPFDVDFFMDDKIQLISADHQLKGEVIVIRLLCKIYSNGYFYQLSEDQIALLARSLADGTRPDEVRSVIKSATDRKIFDKNLYEKYGILTSKGIQKRFVEATERRKKVEVIEQYWLLDKDQKPQKLTFKQLQNVYILPSKCVHDDDNMYPFEGQNEGIFMPEKTVINNEKNTDFTPKNSSKMYAFRGENVDILTQNVDTMSTSCTHFETECLHDDNILPQSKVKESKVKKSKISKSSNSAISDPNSPITPNSGKSDYLDRIISVFQDEFFESREFPYPRKAEDKKHARGIHEQMDELQKARGKILDTEGMLYTLQIYFREALKLQTPWHYQKMGLRHLNSSFTEIMSIIKTGERTHGKTNVTDSQLAATVTAALNG